MDVCGWVWCVGWNGNDVILEEIGDTFNSFFWLSFLILLISIEVCVSLVSWKEVLVEVALGDA